MFYIESDDRDICTYAVANSFIHFLYFNNKQSWNEFLENY